MLWGSSMFVDLSLIRKQLFIEAVFGGQIAKDWPIAGWLGTQAICLEGMCIYSCMYSLDSTCISPFSGPTDISILNFWWCLLWVSKALLVCFITWSDLPLCNNCCPLDSLTFLIHTCTCTCVDKHWWTSNPGSRVRHDVQTRYQISHAVSPDVR